MRPIFFCADMDAFFASVEQHDHPEYKGKPLIVGGSLEHRSVVSACSYEARKFGVHSAMPVLMARKLCPHGIFVTGNMKRYKEVSDSIMEIFSRFTPNVMQNSIDEAFLDMTGTELLFGPPAESAAKIKECVLSEAGLTVSIGIAENMYLAKLASDYRKPNGLYQVQNGTEIEFIDSIPMKKLWGIGKSTFSRLEKSGLNTAARIREYPQKLLASMFGDSEAEFLYKISRGQDPGIFTSAPKTHSISNEITFDSDINDYTILKNTLLALSHKIMFRLMEQGGTSKTLALKLRLDDFSTSTIQTTRQNSFTSAEEVFSAALELLTKKWNTGQKIRLIGLGLQNVDDNGAYQPELFENIHEKQQKVENTILKLNHRYQKSCLLKAALLHRSRSGKY